MPKRKRFMRLDDSFGSNEFCRQKVIYRLARSKKLLYRVLKIARSFERQKLGRRMIRAETVEANAKINLEIKVLKELDLNKVVDTHLYKSLLKVKSFVESGLLPQEVKRGEKESSENAVEDAATNNVISGMFNMRAVKETMEKIMRDMYLTMGIPVSKVKPINEKQPVAKNLIKSHPDNFSENFDNKIYELKGKEIMNAPDSPEWEAFESSEEMLEKDIDETFNKYESTDEELKLYDNRLGTSSDEDSFEEKEHSFKRDTRSSFRAMESKSSDDSHVVSSYNSLDSLPPKKSAKQPNPLQIPRNDQNNPISHVKKGLSTFLPTLMSGYWSGSEESASDLENFTPLGKKKNRRGQMARRAIAEKKYGQMANHIKSGKFKFNKRGHRYDGWDTKRGAVDTMQSLDHTQAYGHAHSGATKLGNRKSLEVTKRNSYMVNRSRIRSTVRHRDDLGNLHPSWQAAKKAKELKETAEFQGKKTKFN